MRETRSYVSARGVRRNPYPYRDSPPPSPCAARLKTLSLENALREGKNSPLTVSDSPTPSSGFGRGIGNHIGQLTGPGSGRRSDTRSEQESARDSGLNQRNFGGPQLQTKLLGKEHRRGCAL